MIAGFPVQSISRDNRYCSQCLSACPTACACCGDVGFIHVRCEATTGWVDVWIDDKAKDDWKLIWYWENFLSFIASMVISFWMYEIPRGRPPKFGNLPCTGYTGGRTGKGAG